MSTPSNPARSSGPSYRTHALVVSTGIYSDPGIPNHPSACLDAAALCLVLHDDVGVAKVEHLSMPDAATVLEKVKRLATQARAGDTLLLYFSGWGRVSNSGSEYLLLMSGYHKGQSPQDNAGPHALSLQYLHSVASGFAQLRWLVVDDTCPLLLWQPSADQLHRANVFAQPSASHWSPPGKFWSHVRSALWLGWRSADALQASQLPFGSDQGHGLLATAWVKCLQTKEYGGRAVLVDAAWMNLVQAQMQLLAARHQLPDICPWQEWRDRAVLLQTPPPELGGRSRVLVRKGLPALILFSIGMFAGVVGVLALQAQGRTPSRPEPAPLTPPPVTSTVPVPVEPAVPTPAPGPIRELSQDLFKVYPATLKDRLGRQSDVEFVVLNGQQPVENEKQSDRLQVAAFGHREYYWGCSDSTKVLHASTGEEFDLTHLWKQYQQTKFWEGTQRMIAVGMASQEGANLQIELNRACSRAEKQLEWLRTAGFERDKVKLNAVVLGQYQSGSSIADGGKQANGCLPGTHMQRQLVMIRVLYEEANLDWSTALRNLDKIPALRDLHMEWSAYRDPDFHIPAPRADHGQPMREGRTRLLDAGECLNRAKQWQH